MATFNGKEANFKSLQVGLTGSIGMGKSTLTKQLMKLGIPVFDADLQVHKLYGHNGGAVEPIQSIFPEVIQDGAVNRVKLTARIMQDPTALQRIESIVHPLVHSERQRFYAHACSERRLMVVYDIPLLFETTNKYELDYTIVASASEHVQRKRVLERPGMTAEKFAAISAKQVPDSEKRERADFVIQTDYAGYAEAKAQLAKVLEAIIDRNPQLFEEWKKGRHQSKDTTSGKTQLSPTRT
jgi:dephospho-CoA kinase